MELVFIKWKDAVSIDPWTSKDEISPDCHIIYTVGILIKEDKDAVIVALNHDTNSDNFSCFIT